MKYLFAILLITGLQTTAQTKKDNTIVISGPVPLSKLKNVLFTNGYILEAGTDTLYFSTQPKQLKASFVIKLLIAKADTLTYVKGLWKEGYSVTVSGVTIESEFSQLYFSGKKNGAYRRTWDEMNRIATLLSDRITYIQQ